MPRTFVPRQTLREKMLSKKHIAKDAVNHPDHYGGANNPYEVIKVLENWLTREEFIGALIFNIIKYQARTRLKAGEQDYKKANWYSNYLIGFLKREPS